MPRIGDTLYGLKNAVDRENYGSRREHGYDDDGHVATFGPSVANSGTATSPGSSPAPNTPRPSASTRSGSFGVGGGGGAGSPRPRRRGGGLDNLGGGKPQQNGGQGSPANASTGGNRSLY